MAFMKNIIDLRGILTLMVLILPSIAANVDCNGKPFHCVNSSHFMICVDLGNGVSKTIDDFVIPCPPTTVCQGTNKFECEFPAVITTVAPSVAPLVTSVSETIETVTTPIYEVITSIPFEEYYNTLSTTTLSEDVLITHQTIATEPTVTESTMQRVTDVIQNTEVIKSGYESNSTFSDTILNADVLKNDFTTLKPLSDNTNTNVTEPIPDTTENVNVTKPGLESTLFLSEIISSVKVVENDLTTQTSLLNDTNASATNLIPNATENIVAIIPESEININLIETILSVTDNAQIESKSPSTFTSSALPIIADTTTASILTESAKTTVGESTLRDTTPSVDIVQNEFTTLTPLPNDIRAIATDFNMDATGSSNVLIPDFKMNLILTDGISSTTDVAQNEPTLLTTSNSSTLIVNITDTITESILTKMTETTPIVSTLKETISSTDLIQNDVTTLFSNNVINNATDLILNSTEIVNVVIPESKINLTLSKTTPDLDVPNNLATLLAGNVVANDTYLIPDVTENVNETISESKTNSTLSFDTLGTSLPINIDDTVTKSILLEVTDTTSGASVDEVNNYLTTLDSSSNTTLPDNIVSITTAEQVTGVTEEILKADSNLTLRGSAPIMPVENVIQDHHTTLEIPNIIVLPSNIITTPTVSDKTANINIATIESIYKLSDETIPTESVDTVKFFSTTPESSSTASLYDREYTITDKSIINDATENIKIVETESNSNHISRRNLTSGSDNIVQNDIPLLYIQSKVSQSKIALPNTSEPVSDDNVLNISINVINKANTKDHHDSVVPDRNRTIKVILTPTKTVTENSNIIVETTPNTNLETTISAQNLILITDDKATEIIVNHQEMLTNPTDRKPVFNEKVATTGTIDTATDATPTLVAVKNENVFNSSLVLSTDAPVTPPSTEATFTSTNILAMNNESTFLTKDYESNIHGDTILAGETNDNGLPVTTLEHNGTSKSFQIVNASELLVQHAPTTESSNYLPLPHLSANADYIEEIPPLTDNMQQSTNLLFDSSNVPSTDITVTNEFIATDQTTMATTLTITETSKVTLSETLPTALSSEKDELNRAKENQAVNNKNAENNITTSSLNKKNILTPAETVTEISNIIVETTQNSCLERTISAQNVISISVGKDTENVRNHQETLTHHIDMEPVFNEKVPSTDTIGTDKATTPVVVKNENFSTGYLVSTDAPVIPPSTEATFTPTDTLAMNNESTFLTTNQESNIQGETTLAGETNENGLPVTILEHNGTSKSFQIVNVNSSDLIIPKHEPTTESSNYLPLPHLSANADYIEEKSTLTDNNIQQSTNSLFDSSNVPSTDINVTNELIGTDQTTMATTFMVTETSKATLLETLPTALSSERDELNKAKENQAVNNKIAEYNTSILDNNSILTPAETVTEISNIIVKTTPNFTSEGTDSVQNIISISAGKDTEKIGNHQEIITNPIDMKLVLNEKEVLSTSIIDTGTAATLVVVKNDNLLTSSLVSSSDAPVIPPSTEATFTSTDTLAKINESTFLTTDQESNTQGNITLAGETNDNVLPVTTLEHNGTNKSFQTVNINASELLVPKHVPTTDSSNYLPLPHLSVNADYIEEISSLTDNNIQQSTNLLFDSSNVPSTDIIVTNEFIATEQTTMATTFTVTETKVTLSETLPTIFTSEKDDSNKAQKNRAVKNKNAEHNTTTSSLNNNIIINDEAKLLTIHSQIINTVNAMPVYPIIEVITTETENNSYAEPPKNIENIKSKLDNIPDLTRSTMSSLLVDNVKSENPSITETTDGIFSKTVPTFSFQKATKIDDLNRAKENLAVNNKNAEHNTTTSSPVINVTAPINDEPKLLTINSEIINTDNVVLVYPITKVITIEVKNNSHTEPPKNIESVQSKLDNISELKQPTMSSLLVDNVQSDILSITETNEAVFSETVPILPFQIATETDNSNQAKENRAVNPKYAEHNTTTSSPVINMTAPNNDEAKLLTISSKIINNDNAVPVYSITKIITIEVKDDSYAGSPKNIESVKSKLDNIPDLKQSTMSSILVDNVSEISLVTDIIPDITTSSSIVGDPGLNIKNINIKNKAKEETSNPVIIEPQTELPVQNAAKTKTVTKIPVIFNNILGGGNGVTSITESTPMNEAKFTVRTSDANVLLRSNDSTVSLGAEAKKENNPLINLLLNNPIEQITYRATTVPTKDISLDSTSIQNEKKNNTSTNKIASGDSSTPINDNVSFVGLAQQDLYTESISHTDTNLQNPLSNNNFTQEAVRTIDITDQGTETSLPAIVLDTQMGSTHITSANHKHTLNITENSDPPQHVRTENYGENISETNQITVQEQSLMNNLETKPTQNIFITKGLRISTFGLNEVKVTNTPNIENKTPVAEEKVKVPKQTKNTTNISTFDQPIEESKPSKTSIESQTEITKIPPVTFIRDSATPKQNIDSSDASTTLPITESWKTTVVTKPYIQITNKFVTQQPTIDITPTELRSKIPTISDITKQTVNEPTVGHVASIIELQAQYVTKPRIIDENPGIGVKSTNEPITETRSKIQGASEITVQTVTNFNLVKVASHPRVENNNVSKNNVVSQTTEQLSIPETNSMNIPKDVVTQSTRQVVTPKSLNTNRDAGIVIVDLVKTNVPVFVKNSLLTDTHSGMSVLQKPPKKTKNEEYEKPEWSESVEEPEVEKEQDSEGPESNEGGPNNVRIANRETILAKSKGSITSIGQGNEHLTNMLKTLDSGLPLNTNKMILRSTMEMTTKKMVENSNSGSRTVKSIEKFTEAKVALGSSDRKDKSTKNEPTITITIASNVTTNSTARYSPKTKSLFANTNNASVRAFKSIPNNFVCKQNSRGRFSDSKDCRKFYICIGKPEPIEGFCPINTVFSELRKLCTKNLSHCVRNNQFQCISEGRFSDYLNDNIYYICVKNNAGTFIRFKLQCQSGYHLNKTSVRCALNTESRQSTSQQSRSDISKNNSDQSVSSARSEKLVVESVKDFECEKEGRFPDANNCRKYYICARRGKSQYRRKIKKCDSDELFHKDKKKCVDADSYECS